LSDEPRARGWLFSFPLLLALCAVVGLGAWWLLGRGRRAEPAPEQAAEPPPAAAPAEPPPPPAPPRAAARAPADAGAPPPVAAAERELLINPPGNDDPRPDGVLHPHPITARHERIFHENALLGQLDGAMDVEDAAGLRRLLDQYKREYPEDPNLLQEGYQVILDCLEHLDSVSRAAAQRYYDVERGSTLRAFVARHCLEK
jgi:hypothetical protein